MSASPELGSQARCAPGAVLEGEKCNQVLVGIGRILVGSECTGHEHTQEQIWRTGSIYWGEQRLFRPLGG